jgi:hypothetical protein
MDSLPAHTRLSRNPISPASTSKTSAASSTSLPLMVSAAARAAMPFRSEPEDAAVGEVLGTLAVVVAVILTRSRSIPKASATTCATFT